MERLLCYSMSMLIFLRLWVGVGHVIILEGFEVCFQGCEIWNIVV